MTHEIYSEVLQRYLYAYAGIAIGDMLPVCFAEKSLQGNVEALASIVQNHRITT